MKKLILTVTVLLPLFSVFAQTKSNVVFDQSPNFEAINIGNTGNPEFQFIADYVGPEELELIQDSIVYESFDTTTYEWVRMKRYNQVYEEDGSCGTVWIKIWNDSTQLWKEFKFSEQCWNDEGEEVYNERNYFSSLDLMDDTVKFYSKTVKEVEFHDDLRTEKSTFYNDPLRNGEMIQTKQEEYTYDASDNQVFYMRLLWSEERAAWDTTETQENAYDEYGNKVKDKVMNWGGNWDLALRGKQYLEWHYNAQNKLDTLVFYVWDYNLTDWIKYSKQVYNYNLDTLLIRELGMTWNQESGVWMNASKTEWDFNSVGNEVLRVDYIWNNDSSDWLYYYKVEMTYAETGEKKMEASYSWNNDSLKWIGSRKLMYEYTNGRQSDYKELHWDMNLNDWAIFEHEAYTYEYDDENRLVLKLTKRRTSDAGSLVNYSKNENTYELNKKISITYSWSSDDAQWLPRGKDELEYNNVGDIILQRNYNWDDALSEWKLQSHHEYKSEEVENGTRVVRGELTNYADLMYYGNRDSSIYNNNYDLVYNTYYSWDDEIKDWKGEYKREQSWIQEHRLDTTTFYLWDEVTWDWIPSSRYIYFYSEIETAVETVENDIDIRVYPNPATQNVTFDIDSDVAECKMELYDMNGKLRLSKNLLQGKTVSVNHLKSGLYFWRVVMPNQVYNGKLIIS